MTIQAIQDFFLVQNIFQLGTNLPEDVVVNNFIFRNMNVLDFQTAQERAADAVMEFFNNASAPQVGPTVPHTGSLIGLMGDHVVSWTQKVYDLGHAPGDRLPTTFVRTGADFPNRSTSAKLPNEVAVCLSLQTTHTGKSGKGRVYLGPFVAAIGESTTGGLVPTEPFRARVAAQADRLRSGNGQDMEWHVYSTVKNRMQRVLGGWVDDAFDTQRRRGQDPTERYVFGSLTPTHSGTTNEEL